jgi:hypothetical protein
MLNKNKSNTGPTASCGKQNTKRYYDYEPNWSFACKLLFINVKTGKDKHIKLITARNIW